MYYRTRLTALVLSVCLIVGALPALASSVTPEEMYENLFTAESVKPEWLTEEVLAQVTTSQLELLISQYKEALGEYLGVEGAAPNYRLHFTNGSTNSQIVLDAQGRIAGLWFGVPEPKVSGLEEAIAPFRELTGDVSLVVLSNQGILGSIDPDRPLAVGSAFKLAIAAALQDQVKAGHRAWDDVVILEEHHKSLPSGIMQEWPTGTPITLQAAATLMISLSDNTATDLLLEVAGREIVELYSAFNKPMLSTREAFTLKDPANAELLEAYRRGDVEQRRAVVAQLREVPLPDASIFYGGPVAIDVEWFFSATELAGLIGYVNELPFLSVNPGVANPADWQRVAFKGGSEPGVLNLTTFLVGHSGTQYAVVATWNDDQEVLNETQFVTLYTGLIGAVKQLDAGE